VSDRVPPRSLEIQTSLTGIQGRLLGVTLRRVMKKFALVPLAVLFGCSYAQDFPVYKFRDKPMPAFQMEDTTGRKISRASMLGKVYLVDFWATWCGPCKAAMPTMQKLNDKYKAQGFMVIGANILEQKDKLAAAAAFKKSAGYTYTFTKNTPGNEKLATSLKIQGIPTFLLIDRKGVIREVQVGFSSAHEAELAKKIEGLLKG